MVWITQYTLALVLTLLLYVRFKLCLEILVCSKIWFILNFCLFFSSSKNLKISLKIPLKEFCWCHVLRHQNSLWGPLMIDVVLVSIYAPLSLLKPAGISGANMAHLLYGLGFFCDQFELIYVSLKFHVGLWKRFI